MLHGTDAAVTEQLMCSRQAPSMKEIGHESIDFAAKSNVPLSPMFNFARAAVQFV